MRLLVCLILTVVLQAQVYARGGVGLTIGTHVSKDDHVPMDFYKLTHRLNWNKRWFTQGNWFVTGNNELSLIRILSNVEIKQKHAEPSLTAIAFSPIFRFQRVAYENGLAPFLEAGIGVSYFSASKIQSQPYWFRDYGSRFQFEDRVSLGLLYNEKYRVSVDATHYSNADFSPPNEGLDLVSLTFSFEY